ncbi:androglobin [Gracilinanus agilis]|uniref:androglobin n=1 Tax=Gracilinanus agilis TaxID=191870 RepID=UPI001CFD3A87|nr:androglobin [Gracilinanus agilis]
MTSKQGKKKELHRINSVHGFEKSKDQSSFGSSTQSGLTEIKRGKFPIWPEWNEADINAEKWDGGKGGKEKDKSGKSPIFHYFDDPEGKIEIPPSLKVFTWKRPQEVFINRNLVVVKDENSFDLFSENGHLLCSELMRWIISEIYAVWKTYNGNISSSSTEPPVLNWKPWEHIYSLCKAVKGHIPLFNSYGKYIVKLYWMGCWRKLTVDDSLPFDEENKLLLPATTYDIELWPMILAKAIIKLTNVDIHMADQRELGEFTVFHALTGWLPEVIPLRNGYLDKVWNFLKEILPEFKLIQESSSDKLSDGKTREGRDSKEGLDSKNGKDFKDGKDGKNGKDVKDGKDGKVGKNGKEEKGGKEGKTESSQGKGADKGDKSGKEKVDVKEGKKKPKDGEKDTRYKLSTHNSRPPSDAQHSLLSVSEIGVGVQIIPSIPQIVVYGTFTPLHLFEKKIFTLEKMTESAEKLRQYGLCHICSHPVLITRTRSCALIAPPKPPILPAWKLIRQKKETVVTDEPQDPIIKKPEQFLEISSPFLNYRMNPIPIPTETHYVLSLLKKGDPFVGLPSLVELDESQSTIDVNITTGALSMVNISQLNFGVTNGTNKEEPAENVITVGIRQSEATDLVSQHTSTLDKSQEEVVAEVVPICKEIWFDFDDFCKCFQNMYIFHKPASYIYSYQRSDFKVNTNENYAVADTLQRLWSLLEVNLEQYSTSLLRLMFKSKCKSFELYSCYQDEETKIAYADYSITYPDQPPNSWFIVFRETFYVTQDMLLVPKMYTTLPVCMLHVVNNDTMEEVPRVFLKVVPYVYTKNKKGYSFVAEAYTNEFYVAPGKWKLRIIGSFTPLPYLGREAVNGLFAMREIKDYYIPNEKQVMFRYSIKVALAHVVTVQVRTSKTDVFIKLQILENEEEAVSTIGKGHAIIPTFLFLSSEKALSSQSSKLLLPHNTVPKKEVEVPQPKKKAPVATPKVNKSRPSGATETLSIVEEDSVSIPTIDENSQVSGQTYKYIIQATVLYNSWPLTESQLAFVQTLRDLEKSDLKEDPKIIKKKRGNLPEFAHEELISIGVSEAHGTTDGQKTTTTSKTTRKGKDKAAEKAEKEKAAKEKVLPKAEPQVKILVSHMHIPYSSHNSNFQNTEDTSIPKDPKLIPTTETATASTADPAAFVFKKELEPLDLTQYIQQTLDEPVLYSEALAQQREMQKAEEVHQFRQYREKILKKREFEDGARKKLKTKVLDTYGDIRSSVKDTHDVVLQPREAYREKLLEEERQRQEALAAQEAALKQEQEKKSPDNQKAKGKGGKKK